MKKMTLIDKIWESHLIDSNEVGDLLYIDMQLFNEVTPPQAFENMRSKGRLVRRPELCLATADHDVPTDVRNALPPDESAAIQLELQSEHCREFGIELHPMRSSGNGIAHVIGPENGVTQPGMTIVCGDSHTATHGAFGAIAFGIGTSQIEHVLATQTLRLTRPKTMSVTFKGVPRTDASAKDLALATVAALGHGGGTGYLIEFRGRTVRSLSMEGRMTLCNMAIETGARSGLVAPDETTIAYLAGKERAPREELLAPALAYWRSLSSDDGARFDREVEIDVEGLGPMITWGTNPSQAVPVGSLVPDPDEWGSDRERAEAMAAFRYMGIDPGMALAEIPIDVVFIGSCTNGRLEDLVAAAGVVKGHKVAEGVKALVVPGSQATKAAAEGMGLAEVFVESGFEWRAPGCSMCVGMNGDIVPAGKHSVSTSNRNFEGRQGPGARTHLASPETAAATAIAGRICSASELFSMTTGKETRWKR